MFNTVSPDRSGDPRDDPVIYSKQMHFKTLLEDLSQVSEAYQYARELSREIWDNSKELDRLANAMFRATNGNARDLAFARRLVTRAIEVSERPDPNLMASMARIEEALGSLAEAVQWLKKAVDLAPAGRLKQGLGRQLESLQKKVEARS